MTFHADSPRLPPTSQDYRPDIDGLRALAVLAVVAFHAFPDLLKGGFVGVDIFFVISGFLICGIILSDLGAGAFSFRQFYAHRIRRLFPALIPVLAASCVAGWYFLLPDEFDLFARNLVGSTAFMANFSLLRNMNYFDIASDHKPLLHLWSLGVEEQFYVVAPLILFLIVKQRFIKVFDILLCFGVASFALNIAMVGTNHFAAFFLPYTRAWELLMGGFLAATSQQKSMRWRMPHAPDVKAVFGLALIVAALMFINKNRLFPGWWALMPTVGASLIITAEKSWLNRKILSNPFVISIGLISYPLYLWHWPLFAFARIKLPVEPDLHLKMMLLEASVALAGLTYLLIERPLRARQPTPMLVYILCAAMLLIGDLGFHIVYNNGYDYRMADIIRDFTKENPKPLKEWREHSCFLEAEDDAKHYTADCEGGGRRPLIVLWGDSHAAALYPGFQHLADERGFGVAEFTGSDCRPMLQYIGVDRPFCTATNDFILERIKQLKPDVVVLHSLWESNDNLDLLDPTIKALHEAGVKRIIVLGPMPRWDRILPHVYQDYYDQTVTKGLLLPEYSNFNLSGQTQEKALRGHVAHLDAIYVSPRDILCNVDGCLTRIGKNPGQSSELTNLV